MFFPRVIPEGEAVAGHGAAYFAGEGDEILSGLQGFQSSDGVLLALSRVGVVARVGVSFVLVEEVAARVAMAGGEVFGRFFEVVVALGVAPRFGTAGEAPVPVVVFVFARFVRRAVEDVFVARVGVRGGEVVGNDELLAALFVFEPVVETFVGE